MLLREVHIAGGSKTTDACVRVDAVVHLVCACVTFGPPAPLRVCLSLLAVARVSGLFVRVCVPVCVLVCARLALASLDATKAFVCVFVC